VFDATSAGAHIRNDALLRAHKPGIKLVDLTPAAIGPYCVPVVNLEQHLAAGNVNMVTCGGQATIPVVAAVSRVAKVHYAEIVASISQQVRRSRHPRQYRRVHRDHLEGPSSRSAARPGARPSSCSTRPSRR
jgi:acetaldehyde dehydrogenase (acetylating)